MNFANVKAITIPEGDVKSIAIGGVTVWQKSNPLPYDAEVEYVESTGTQYVDTGLLCSGADEVSLTVFMENGDIAGTRVYFGASGDARAWATSGFCRFGGDNYADVSPLRVIGAWNTITLNQSRAVVNGTSIATTLGAFQGTSNLTSWIFRANGMPSAVPPVLKISEFSWKRNGALVRSFVPVRVGSVGYLYDRANPTGGPSGNGLYGSATSTPLVAGPDKNGD